MQRVIVDCASGEERWEPLSVAEEAEVTGARAVAVVEREQREQRQEANAVILRAALTDTTTNPVLVALIRRVVG